MALLSAGTLSLQAQKPVMTPASQEINLQNFWFGSANSAALAFSPLEDYGDVLLKYSYGQGDLRHAQQAQSESAVKAAASGALRLKGYTLWGDFSYDNIFSRGSLYNANLYEPRFSMPYYICDAVLSDWKRQNYDMGFKMAAPAMASDRLALGLEARYSNKVGAKQVDPRAVSYVLSLQLTPSVAYRIGSRSVIGLSLDYQRYKERTSHSTENYQKDQQVALMRGLGIYTQGIVGGNLGFGNIIYSGNRFGGEAEYSLKADGADWFVSAGGSYETITVLERPSFPRMRGKTGTIAADLALKANFGELRNHRVAVKGDFSRVTGYEYTQELVTSPKREWLTLMVLPMSYYTFAAAAASYDFYHNLTPGGYDSSLGAEVGFDMMDQSYQLSYFNSMSLDAALRGAKNFGFAGGRALLAKASAGYHLPLKAEYLYAPISEDTGESIVAGLYPGELAYLNTQFIDASLNLTYSLPIAKGRNNLYFRASGRYLRALNADTDRLNADLTVGMMF